MWACRGALGKTWGLKPKVALWIYKTVLRPRLLHAAVIWWHRVTKVEARNLLNGLQGSYLRAVAGTMKTTPTEALGIAHNVTPLDLKIMYAARSTAYRLFCQGEWKDNGLGHTRLGFLQKHPFNLKQDRIPRKFQGNDKIRAYIPTREEWKNPDLIINQIGRAHV